jgi:hypothetical protein
MKPQKKYYVAKGIINNCENLSKFHHTILAPEMQSTDNKT